MFSPRTHRLIYLTLLTLLGGCMVCSTWASNLLWVLLAVNWMLEGRWREKWQMAKSSRLLHLMLTLWGLYALGLLWTSNMAAGWNAMELVLPLLAVPVVTLTTSSPTGRAKRTILWLYASTVAVVSIIGLVRMITIQGLPYRDAIPYISHIRFALNCCVVIYICLSQSGRGPWRYAAWALAAWMAVFVFMLRSYTAVAVLALVSLTVILLYHRRWQWVALWLAVATCAIGLVAHHARQYYRMVPAATQPLQALTAGGRPYLHTQDGLVENGNYVKNYICLEELRSEWQRRAGHSADTPTPSGFTVEDNLIRYLNALGLPKDSVGVASLTPAQMEEVAGGVANPVYRHGSQLQKMVYVLLFEYENYRCYRAVEGFSMLQRLELWRATLNLIRHYPWTGTGTGDLVDGLEQELQALNSPLQGHGLSPHNQYLSLTATFGLVALALLMALFLRAAGALRRQPPLVVAWVLTVLISFLTENTLGSLAGILLCTWFMAFRKP